MEIEKKREYGRERKIGDNYEGRKEGREGKREMKLGGWGWRRERQWER